MLSFVAQIVTQIGEADDRNGLRVVIQNGLSTLGFASFNLSCNKQRPEQLVLEPTLTTWSQPEIMEYAANYQQDEDPVLAHSSAPGQPMVWSPRDWDESKRFGKYAHYLVNHGILGGVTAPLAQRPNGALSAITAVSYSREAISAETGTAIYVIGQAGMMRATALGLTDASPASALATLSETQTEILQWASQGKSNAAIATITGRTPRTVAYHMSEILRKLGVSTRAQAVARFLAR